MDDFKAKSDKDQDCHEYVCQRDSLYHRYKKFISKEEDDPDYSEKENEENHKKFKECPLSKDTLGFYTWSFLHTLAAYYPEKPNDKEKSLMKNFIESFAFFYPCKICSVGFKRDIEQNPVKLNNTKDLSVWLCERHNTVNKKLGKDVFDCDYENLRKRWKSGYSHCSSAFL